MAATNTRVWALPEDQRQLLESWLVDFDQSWDEGRLSARAGALPPTGNPLRLPALIEMVKIDVERNWERGRRVGLEAYLERFPELGTPDTVPADLLQAECEVRQQFGDSAALADLERRFPRRAQELRRLLEQSPGAGGAPSGILVTRATPMPQTSTYSDAPAAPAPGALPEQFGRYRILKLLGKGGMGSVYLAHDTQLDRPVALKVPRLRVESPEVLERFYREARAAAALRHPHICPVYDVGQVNGIPFLTMAYIDGRPLSELVRAGQLPPQAQAAALVRQLALALEVAHRHGVIHRDLKPANVLLNQDGEPVITDFGLARRLHSGDVRLTRAGAVLGTPAYMPPEQVSGDTAAMGPACDIYSLGVILYELLTGRLPFRGSDPLVVMGQILHVEPERPSGLRPGLDPQVEVIVMRAMAKKIEDRYGTMGELATALGDYLRQEESRSGPVTRLAPSLARSATQETVPGGPVAWEGHPPKVPPRRWRWAVAGALVGAVALLLSGIVIRYRDKDGKEKAIHIKDVGPGSEITVKTDGGRLVAGGSVPDERELERPAVGQVKNPAKAPLPEKPPEKPSAAQGVAGKSPPTKEKPPLEEQRAAEVATPLTEVGPRDADSPVALKPFAPVKATLGRDQSTYLSASLPAGEYQVVLDTSRADGWCSNLQSRLSVVDEDGQVQDHNWISFNEIDFGFRHTRGFALKAPATVRFRLSSTNDPSYFWLTLVKMPGDKRARLTDSDLTEADLRRYDPRKADLMPFPFYGKILPRLLKVGQAAKGTLEGGVDGSPYYIALLPKGEYKAILDLATADGGSTNIQAYLALLGADGGGQRSLCTVNDIDASSRAVGRFTLPRPAVVLFRLGNSSSGTVYRYALTVRPAAGG